MVSAIFNNSLTHELFVSRIRSIYVSLFRTQRNSISRYNPHLSLI